MPVQVEYGERDGVAQLVLTGNLDERMPGLGPTEAAVTGLAPGSKLMVDLRGLTSWTALGRASLVDLHRRHFKAQSLRTCYLVDRPRLHGMALLVARLAEDDQATAATSTDAARRWFASSLDRHAHKIEAITRTHETLRGGTDG